MSKKNKALKQLLKAQMQANASASAQGKDLNQQVQTTMASPVNQGPVASASQPVVADKQTSEFTMIRKDIRLSVFLIIIVIVLLVVIYLVDHYNPFLLNLANAIFKVI